MQALVEETIKRDLVYCILEAANAITIILSAREFVLLGGQDSCAHAIGCRGATPMPLLDGRCPEGEGVSVVTRVSIGLYIS